jgi:Ca2+-binding RTX toxin-like protein
MCLKRTLAAGAMVLALASPATAPASTVSVEETQGTYAYEVANFANLRFTGSAGEDNAVVIKTTGEQDGSLRLTVVDHRASLTAGSGCSGGGPPGTPALCTIHAPRPPDTIHYPFKTFTPVPGTRWVGSMTIDLGDGRNAFDAATFTGELDRSFAMTVTAGEGDDRIVTGGGNDLIDPGAGSDFVRTDDGPDRVLATALPDGPDVYDLGPKSFNPPGEGGDKVDYGRRQVGVFWSGTEAGAPGEDDRLIRVESVIGGSGNDVLEGNVYENHLLGGAGDDVLAGGFNFDGLYGGAGADVLRGGTEPDRLVGEAGDDVLSGGRNRDGVICGTGRDTGFRNGPDRFLECELLRLPGGAGLDVNLRSP